MVFGFRFLRLASAPKRTRIRRRSQKLPRGPTPPSETLVGSRRLRLATKVSKLPALHRIVEHLHPLICRKRGKFIVNVRTPSRPLGTFYHLLTRYQQGRESASLSLCSRWRRLQRNVHKCVHSIWSPGFKDLYWQQYSRTRSIRRRIPSRICVAHHRPVDARLPCFLDGLTTRSRSRPLHLRSARRIHSRLFRRRSRSTPHQLAGSRLDGPIKQSTPRSLVDVSSGCRLS